MNVIGFRALAIDAVHIGMRGHAVSYVSSRNHIGRGHHGALPHAVSFSFSFCLADGGQWGPMGANGAVDRLTRSLLPFFHVLK